MPKEVVPSVQFEGCWNTIGGSLSHDQIMLPVPNCPALCKRYRFALVPRMYPASKDHCEAFGPWMVPDLVSVAVSV